MTESHGKFATGLDCADGRTKLPVRVWAREHLGVDNVDLLTRPGMDHFLTTKIHPVILEDLHEQLRKLEAHGSKYILVIGHCGCAGNPVPVEDHRQHITESCKVVRSWDVAGKRVIGLLVNENWQVEEVVRI